MANVEHSTLTGTNLHENKGVATATDDFVATATSGATVWKKLTAANLTGTGNPFGGQLFHVSEVQAQGVTGATNTVSGTYSTCVLNTSITNEISGASLSSNHLVLPAGTYYAEGEYPPDINNDGASRLRLRNTTDNTTLITGMNWYIDGGASHPAIIRGRFTLSGTKNVELQFRGDTETGGAPACNFAGESEFYTNLRVWKIA